MTDGLRVRFAPSPTGYFHVGGAKTALYNWIVARQSGGTFILRIEDTDTERNRAEWTEGIQSALRWLGIDWDEGPYFQSERTALYREAAERLLATGAVYACDCAREDVAARTKGAARPGYDGFCRERGLEPGPGRALRFRTPREGHTVVRDVIRGEPSFEHALIEDFVVQRSDGSAVFLLANVVDDIDMRVNLVIRGEEHLPNTPKALLLWRALEGGPEPTWAHVPVLVNEKRQKLSKRRDPVALEGYRDEGFLPEAMRNFLMLLGWSPPGDEEIVPFERIMETFRLEDTGSSPAFFDVRKLRAINGHYIRALDVEEFVARCEPWLDPAWDRSVVRALAPLVQTRVEVLSEVRAAMAWVLEEPVLDEAAWRKATKDPAAVGAFLDAVIAAWERVDWKSDELKASLEAEGQRLGLKKAQVPVRVAVSGTAFGIPLYEPLELLGRDTTLERLRAARRRLAADASTDAPGAG